MFVKATVFLALVAFVNAAPIVGYYADGSPVKSSPSDAVDYTTEPGVDFPPPHIIKVNLPDGGDAVHPKRDISLDIAANPGVDVRPWHPIKVSGLPVTLKRGLPLEISANPGVDVHPLQPIWFPLPVVSKRDLSLEVDADFAGLSAQLDSEISKRGDPDSSSSAGPDPVLPDNGGTISVGINGDKPGYRPGKDTTESVLYQLQDIFNNIGNIYPARDASNAANGFMAEGKGGGINVNGLLSTTNEILASLR